MELIKSLGCLGTNLKDGNKQCFGLFLCPVCNKEVVKQLGNGELAKSCGCNRFCMQGDKHPSFKHGENNERLYHIWKMMRQRGSNSYYKNYRAKGVSVCKEWDEYLDFKKWALENGYQDNLTIDRADNNKGYYPKNCRWVTKGENSINRDWVKTNATQVKEIRKLYSSGCYKFNQLAEMFNLRYNIIYNLVKRNTWSKI